MSRALAGDNQDDFGGPCPQRAIFRAAEVFDGGGTERPEETTPGGLFSRGLIEGMCQTVNLTADHVNDIFGMPDVIVHFGREARLAIPIHFQRIIEHVRQIQRLLEGE